MSADKILVTLDATGYTSKPSQYVGAITNRMKKAGPSEVTREELAEAIRQGRTSSHGCFKASAGDWGEFVGMSTAWLDFDNDITVHYPDGRPVKDASGHKLKRQLMEHEEGYLDPVAALDRCEQLELTPLLLYFSFRASCPDKVKYRLVIDLGELVTDEGEAKGILETLMTAFPECDSSCSNLNRLFFGTRPGGEVWECWKSWEARP